MQRPPAVGTTCRKFCGLWLVAAAIVGGGLVTCRKEPAPKLKLDPPMPDCAEVERRQLDPSVDVKVAAEQWLRCYRAGKLVRKTANPTVVYHIGKGGKCKPLPKRRPAGFQARFWRRGQEPDRKRPTYGISDSVCRFTWFLLAMSPRPAHCVVLDAVRFDAFYAALRKLAVHRVKMRDLKQFSPHRGGSGLTLEWPGAYCELNDILGSEILQGSRPSFEAALKLFRETYNAGNARRTARRPRASGR
jgi:hypothetical protein